MSFVGEKFGFVAATVDVPVDVLGVVPVAVPMVAGRLGPVAVILNGVPVEVALVPVLDETVVLLAAVGLAGVADVPPVLVLARSEVLLAVGLAGDVPLVPALDKRAVLLKAVGLAGVAGASLVPALARENVLLMGDWPVGVAEEPLAPVFDNEKVPTTAGWLPGGVVIALLLGAFLLWPADAFSPAVVLVAAESLARAPF